VKKICFAATIVTAMCAVISVARAENQANGEKLFKSKCAGCHGADAAGKPAVKPPSIKGKTADDIQKAISTSAKHTGLKRPTTDQVRDIAAFPGTLK